MPNTRSRRGTPTSQETLADTHLRHLTTEVLRLRLGQLNLVTTGSRSALLARLTTALKDRPNASANQRQRSQTDDDDPMSPEVPEPPSVAREPRVEQTTRSGGFTSEQLDTLKCLISSSIEDSIPRLIATPSQPIFNAVAQPSQPPTDLLSPPAPSSLFDHLPEKTINSITNGEYIDFNSLLPGNVDGYDDNLRISFQSSEGGAGFTIPVSLSQPKRQKIDSIDRWLTAFNIYSSVVANKFPYKAADLFSYQQTIRDAQRKFSGMAWYAYDIAFRKRASKNPSLSWAQRDLQLYLEKFTGLAKTACHVCGSADHFLNSCPLAPHRPTVPSRNPTDPFCRNFNRNQTCATEPCPYKHRCNKPGCNGTHSAIDHDAKFTDAPDKRRQRR